jgi:hypothetical protein
MRALGCCLPLLLISCADGTSTLALTVGSLKDLSGVETLELEFTDVARGTRSQPVSVSLGGVNIPPARELSFSFPPSVRGTVHIDARARNAGGELANGGVDAVITPSQASAVTLTLGVQASGPPPDPALSTVTVDRASGVVANGADASKVTVTLRDAEGKPIPGGTVVLMATGMGGSFSTPAATDDAGVTTSSFSSTVAETKTITAIGNGVPLTQMPAVTFIAGAVARLQFITQPKNGVTLSPLGLIRVGVTDAQGNPVMTAGNEITVALGSNPSGSNLMGVPTATASMGQAGFPLLGLDKAGMGYTLVASATGLTSATSMPFNVRPVAFNAVSTGLFGGQVTSIAVGKAPVGGPASVWATTNAGTFKSTNNGATWSPAGFGLGSPGGTVYADPKTAGTAYIVSTNPSGGSFSGAFYFAKKTTNDGGGWLDIGMQGMGSGSAMAIDPMNPQIIYVAANGVYKSTNGGATWTKTSFPLEANAIAVDPVTPSNVYATAYDRSTFMPKGVYKSSDSGTMWAEVNTGLTSLDTDFLVASPNALFVNAGNALYRSTNGAGNWTPVAGITFPYALAWAPSMPTRVYLARGGAGVHVSNDSGATFGTAVSTGDVMQTLAVDPTNANLVYGGGRNDAFWTSTTGGASWTNTSTGISARSVGSLAMVPSVPDTVLASTSQGVFRTTNGGVSWSLASSAAGGHLLFDATTPTRAYACGGTLYTSIDSGASWTAGGAIGTSCTQLDVRGATMYASGLNSGTRKSVNSGGTWAATGLVPTFSYSVAITDAAAMNVLTGTNAGLYRSVNGGTTFTQLSLDLVDALAVDRATPTRVYAGLSCGTGGGGAMSNGGFRVSTDGGATWGAVIMGPCVSSFFSTATTVYAAARPSSAFSTNGGTTWTPLGEGIPDGFEAQSVVASADGTVVYIATLGGLYKSTTSGQ